MNRALIIVFGKNDIKFNNSPVFKKLAFYNITICLVSNGDNQLLLETLENIEKSYDSKISIVNLRKEKSLLSAVKAGVRSLTYNAKFDTIFYIDAPLLNLDFEYKTFKKLLQPTFVRKNTKNVLLRNIHAIHEFE